MSVINISGPVNVVRIEGTVSNKKKILYLFFDIHNPVDEQTSCREEDIDIKNYLVSNFNKLDKLENKIDFFFEINPLSPPVKGEKVMYIEDIAKLFRKRNGKYENIRFHYIDVRPDFLDHVDDFYKDIDYNNKKQKKKFKSYVKSMLDLVIHGMDKKIVQVNKNNINYHFIYLINKIFHKYQNKKIEKKLVPFFRSITEAYTNEITNNLKTKSSDQIKKLYSGVFNLYSMLVDMYFIRRFLDKDYISTGIVYAGAGHTSNIIYLLVKYFNFKVTHISKSEYTIKELNKKLKKIDSFSESKELFYKSDSEQCSNIEDFPESFK